MERPSEEKGKVRYSIGDRVTTYMAHSITDNSRGSLLVLKPGWALPQRSGTLVTRP